MGKAISNEKIIAALLGSRTIKEAAGELGITEKTLHNRMNNYDFRVMYQTAQADILKDSVKTCHESLTEAVNTVREIMQDRDINPAVRLQAAQTIIKTEITLYATMEQIRNATGYEWE